MHRVQQDNLNSDKVNGEDGKSSLISRNISVFGKRTSVRLEPEMWQALREIAKREKCTIHEICTLVHLRKRSHSTLTASIRVFLMLYFKAATTDEGHVAAGHGCFENMKCRARITGDIRDLNLSIANKDKPVVSANSAGHA